MTDIKQFVYCPRAIYYTYVEPVPKKISFKMALGREKHRELIEKEKRRGFTRYNLKEGEKQYGVSVRSERLNFNGKIDIVIDTKDKEGQRYFPVECKDTDQKKLHANAIYQLTAYAMALEEETHTPVRQGFVYVIPENKAYPVHITDERRDYVKKMVTMIKRIVQEEHYPEPRSRKRCWDCEFKRYCNDLDIPSFAEKNERNTKKVQKLLGYKRSES